MSFMVTQVSSVMMSSTNGAWDLHENLLCIGNAAFLGYDGTVGIPNCLNSFNAASLFIGLCAFIRVRKEPNNRLEKLP